MIRATCSTKPAHGYFPPVHHARALAYAERDHPRNPKWRRMLDHLCLIYGGPLR